MLVSNRDIRRARVSAKEPAWVPEPQMCLVAWMQSELGCSNQGRARSSNRAQTSGSVSSRLSRIPNRVAKCTSRSALNPSWQRDRGWNPTPTVSPPARCFEEQATSFMTVIPSSLSYVPRLQTFHSFSRSGKVSADSRDSCGCEVDFAGVLNSVSPVVLSIYPSRLMSLSDSSDSSRGRNIPVHKRKMVWSSSDGSEASLSGRPEPDSGAESSSEQRGDSSQFVAREDAIADIAWDEDLPDDPEAVLNRRARPPAPDEAGVSRWQNVPELPILPEVKSEMVTYDPAEGARLLQLAIQGAMVQRKKTRAKKVKKPDPPGSTLSTSDSLRDLKARFNFSEGITMRLPTPSERADDPPEGFFTLYEGFFYFCFLWFPIPRPIIEYLWSYKLALAQITTRGLRHLIGILIRGIETYNNIGLDHLKNLLEIRRVPGCAMERYYISPRARRRVIGGFPSKDEKYTDHFFFVALDEDCVPEGCLGKMIGKWRKIDRGPSFLDRIPEDLFSVHEELAARKCHWIKHFSQGRVEKALRVLHGASCSTSSSSSDQRLGFLTEMQGVKMSLREKKAAEKKAREEQRTIEAAFGTLTPPEVIVGTEVVADPETIVDPVESGTGLAVTVALSEVPEGISTGDVTNRIPEVGSALVVASANLIASCAWPLLPAPEGLVEAERYGETAANFLKKVAEAMTTMETAVAQVAAEQEARRKEAEENVRVRRKAEAEIERLKRLLTEEKALRETEVSRARKAGERKITGEFVEKVKMTEARLAEFDKVSERYVYFSQAKANAELIEALEAGGKIEDEKLEVAKWKEEYGGAEAEYARLGAELLGYLKIPPVSPDSTHDGLGNRSVESEAADAGVLDQAGTNLDSEAGDVPEGEQDE
ncbi:hypothetical protein ISN44_As12g036210 [Arabidopsis suecica]|uniref:Transposase (Putative), gypsy type n=1 Tax=Arabidopsis suecica TaxID=45249 RepID=A0A8T1YQ97_ARASU|nr:hypothetical protein ISN44_As12g036210 [Arabidopsis suecica]